MEQQKWVTKLLGYNYEIVYKKGVKNLVADALWHIPEHVEIHVISTPTWPTFDLIKQEHQNNPKFQKIVKLLEQDPSSIPHHSWLWIIYAIRERTSW